MKFDVKSLKGECSSEQCNASIKLGDSACTKIASFKASIGNAPVLTKKIFAIHLKHSLNEIWLDKYAAVSPEISTLLKTPRATHLYLNGIQSLSDDEARAISTGYGDLFLDGLAEITPKALRSVSGRKCKGGITLSLSGLPEITVDSAEIIARNKNLRICLDGVKALKADVAAALAALQGSDAALGLDGVQNLDEGVAKALRSAKCDISLDGLSDLSPEAARFLCAIQGGVSLNGLTKVSDKVAGFLGHQRGALFLNGLRTLSVAAADALSMHDGPLGLDGLKTISTSAAKALEGHRGGVSLMGLSDVCDKTAQALSCLEELEVSRVCEDAVNKFLI